MTNQTSSHIAKAFCALEVFSRETADHNEPDISTYNIDSNSRTEKFLKIFHAVTIWTNYRRGATYFLYQDQQNSTSIFSGKFRV